MQETRGTAILRGDPKKAVVKLSVPMMLAMLVQTVYNLVDGVWVAGLGPQALAAVGLFFPVFMIVLSLAMGVGVGASAVVAKKVGERDKKGADAAATTAVFLALAIGTVTTFVSLSTVGPLLKTTNASPEVLGLSLDYAKVLLLSLTPLMFNNVTNGVLRGEGNATKAMYAMTVGSLLNVVLDPIFIYSLGMGVKGAAYATVISILVSTAMISYWFFVKRDTYVNVNFKRFRLPAEVLRDILKVGIPASLAQISMFVATFVLNAFAVKAGGDEGVAVFSSAWRIVSFGTVPMQGIAMAVTSVVGTAYGERNVKKMKEAYLFSVKLGFLLGVLVTVCIAIFSPFIAKLFTYSKSGASIHADLVKALRILSLFLPGVPFGMFTSSMFQGIGQGGKSLAITLLRTVVMQVVFSWIFVSVLGAGLVGVWWGIVVGNVSSAVISFNWGRYTLDFFHA